MAAITVTAPQDVATGYPHIVRQPGIVGGRPRVAGTRIPVWQIAHLWQLGELVDGILTAFPRLTPASLHSALAYYWDHQAEIDAEITENQPEYALAELRRDPLITESSPGVFLPRSMASTQR